LTGWRPASGIVHRGRLIEELDSEALERHRDPRLEIGARDLDAAEAALRGDGFVPGRQARDGGATFLELREPHAIEAPDEIARFWSPREHPQRFSAVTTRHWRITSSASPRPRIGFVA